MKSFPLKIVTPDGLQYEGEAQELIVRTTTGDLGIMAGHVDLVAPLGMGRATVVTEEGKRYAACIGGILTVLKGEVRLVPTTFEWADRIDVDRAADAEARARKTLEDKAASDVELRLAEARLRRALVRKSVGSMNRNP